MWCSIWIMISVVSLAGMTGGIQLAQADNLTVVTYVELSVARLQLAKDTWEREQRAPSAGEEAALYQRYGTTIGAYYAFTSTHRKAIEGYLAAHPEVQARIERLSERLHELIEQAERQ